jgi:hypothetical protein
LYLFVYFKRHLTLNLKNILITSDKEIIDYLLQIKVESKISFNNNILNLGSKSESMTSKIYTNIIDSIG